MLLVVDTNVARSAGEGRPSANTPGPESVRVLETIYQRANNCGDMQVAFSMSLVVEWNVHARRYALDWLALMRSRGFVSLVHLDDMWQDVIRDAARMVGQNCLVPICKDLHLVSLAMQTDRRVVSHEVALLKHLKSVAVHCVQLGGLYWARPCCPATLAWLERGAPDDELLAVVPSV